MQCKFCNAELADEAVFCPECGKSVTEEPQAQAVPAAEIVAPKKALKIKFGFNEICLVVGTLLILIGFIRLMDSSISISSTSFGADFYTYTYKGIVACAEMLSKIHKTLSWCLIGLGAVIDIKAIKERLKNK